MTEREADAAIRVGTLNVLGLFDPEALACAVKRHIPLDVLALQEVGSSKRAHAFASALGMRVAVMACGDDKVGLSNALLVGADEQVGTCHEWKLYHHRESRTAVALQLPRIRASFICTHLDHRDEEVRLLQLDALRSQHPKVASSQPLFLIGDFNSIRRDDYDDAAWEALVRERQSSRIETETRVVEQIEREWAMVDCRTVAQRCVGETPTCIHKCRIDYVWASTAALAAWRVGEVTHTWLHVGVSPDEEEQEMGLLTDHTLVVCTLALKSELK